MIVNCKNTKTLNFGRNDIANAYLAEIRQYAVLSADEQRELLVTIKNGSKTESDRARVKLIESNQRFVLSFARKFANLKNELDLVQEANIGLIEAIDRFDLSKDNDFITYAAHWMRRHINYYLANLENAVTPANAQKIFTYAKKAKNKFYHENHRQPTAEETQELLEKEYNVRISHAEDLSDYVSASIDETMDDNDQYVNTASREYDMRTASNNIAENIDREALSEQIRQYLSVLTEKERNIMMLSYGIGREEPMSNEEIGERYGLCAERIRQIVKASAKKMNKAFVKSAVKTAE